MINIPKNIPDSVANYCIIVDCEFEYYHNDKQLISFCTQIGFCYSEVKKNKAFPLLIFCGIGKRTLNQLKKQDIDLWTCIITEYNLNFIIESGLVNFIKKFSVINKINFSKLYLMRNFDYYYLSYDANLQFSNDFDINTNHNDTLFIFIIGGIVDRNCNKKLSLDKANILNLKSIALPKQMTNFLSTKILTTYHTLALISRKTSKKTWYDCALEILPRRIIKDKNLN